MATSRTHYFTVGLRYAREDHPTATLADPESWIEVRGTTAWQARLLVTALIGNRWAFQYDEETFNRGFHSASEPFLVIDVTPAGSVAEIPEDKEGSVG